MKWKLILLGCGLLPLQALAQTEGAASSATIPELPSAKAPTKIPEAERAEPTPDLSGAMEESTSSVPKLRLPAADPAKSNDKDWAAQAMIAKQEAAKKKQADDAVLEDQKSKEKEAMAAKDSKGKAKKGENDLQQPAISKSSMGGVNEADANKLPTVTGMEGVKPRAMGSGDGRVQPGFESFTGPSSTGPLGQDYQSGARPIMPPSGANDGRLASASKVPEVPSGGYKRISQDPYSLPPGSEDKKKATPQPKPTLQGKTPPAGNPLTPGSPAGYSPYDNLRIVPDPRSTRRF